MTALMNAAGGGHTETVVALLDAGADVNAMISNGRTALGLADEKYYDDIVDILIAAGAPPGP